MVCVRLHDLGEDFELESGRSVIVLARNSTDELEATIKRFKVDAGQKPGCGRDRPTPTFNSRLRFALANNQDDGLTATRM